MHLCITVFCVTKVPNTILHRICESRSPSLPSHALSYSAPPIPKLFSQSLLRSERAGWESAVNPDPLPRGALVTAGWLLSTGEGRNKANKRKENRNTFPGPGGCASYQYKFHTKVLSRSALQGASGTIFFSLRPQSPILLVPWWEVRMGFPPILREATGLRVPTGGPGQGDIRR